MRRRRHACCNTTLSKISKAHESCLVEKQQSIGVNIQHGEGVKLQEMVSMTIPQKELSEAMSGYPHYNINHLFEDAIKELTGQVETDDANE
jgi:hypothetical protein